jgi:hypothetical protein
VQHAAHGSRSPSVFLSASASGCTGVVGVSLPRAFPAVRRELRS